MIIGQYRRSSVIALLKCSYLPEIIVEVGPGMSSLSMLNGLLSQQTVMSSERFKEGTQGMFRDPKSRLMLDPIMALTA